MRVVARKLHDLLTAADGNPGGSRPGTGQTSAGGTALVRDLTLHDPGNVGLNHVSFSADGTLLADSSPGGHVYVWDLATGKLAHTVNTTSQVSVDPAFSPDGTLLAVGDGGHVCVWNVATQTLVADLITPGTLINALAFSPNSLLPATSTVTGSVSVNPVQVWDVATGSQIDTPLAGAQDVEKGGIQGLASSPDGKLLAASGGGPRQHLPVGRHH